MDQGVGILLAGAVAAVPGVLNFWGSRHAQSKLDAIHDEVKTLNDKPIGQLAAEDETRRIEGIPHDARTVTEQRHVDESPPPEPPQGPSR